MGKSFVVGLGLACFLLDAALVLAQQLQCDLFDSQLVAVYPRQLTLVYQQLRRPLRPAMRQRIAQPVHFLLVFYLKLRVEAAEEFLVKLHEERVGELPSEEHDVHRLESCQIPKIALWLLLMEGFEPVVFWFIAHVLLDSKVMIGPSYYKLYQLLLGLLVGADLVLKCSHQLLEKCWALLPFLGELGLIEALEGLLVLHFLDVEEQHFFKPPTEATFIMQKELSMKLTQRIQLFYPRLFLSQPCSNNCLLHFWAFLRLHLDEISSLLFTFPHHMSFRLHCPAFLDPLGNCRQGMRWKVLILWQIGM